MSAPDEHGPTTASIRRSPRWWRRFVVASRKANFFLILELVAALGFAAMVWTTYYTFSSAPPDGQLLPSRQVAVLLIATLIPAMTLVVLFGRRLALRRAANSTARMHVRLVFFFSLVAALPTLLVAAFAAFLFQTGVDFWFSDNSRGLMQNANNLARGYYEQNQLQVSQGSVAMAADIGYYLESFALTDPAFVDVYGQQMLARDLSESAILQRLPSGSLRTAAIANLRSGNEPLVFAESALPMLNEGEPIVVAGNTARIEALVPIDKKSGVYLYNARSTEALGFSQWARAQSIVAAYDVLTKRARALQLRFNLALFFVSIALVILAVWFALRLADRMVDPLSELVGAARRIGAGDFVRVEGRTGSDEIGMLNRAFNRMAGQIEQQTAALLGANRQLEERRAFIEAVIESISAGIVTLDREGRVLLMNSSAQELLLGEKGPVPASVPLLDLAPQLAGLADGKLASGLVNWTKGGELLTLAVKVADAPDGRVITFEDITRQILDQRQAAWSDVARRIAHEIKNPLTPIQLATERLKRRYRKQIESDGDLFDELTNTIVRQVGDLRKMVDEFSSFARLPKPVFRPEDAQDLVKQALFLQEVAHPEIDYAYSSDADGIVTIAADRHQIGQAMTNVLKNAAEAIEARARNAEPDYRGRIAVTMSATEDLMTVTVDDNGVGLPQDRERIVEPYVTTREKGTGLGLAIVNKIVEEHGGDMTFASAPGGESGTRVTLRFARDPLADGGTVAAE
ncbi:Alginate biosynthesis sensor protein KinB [Tsuneonella dongtanensis]|uniref:histidine kinase n=1 Tax=Tsuneonella dongtanensis TaxID=692370 RepID=A0A1B2AEU5_9SPHN|nr:ATP-binding protein [Tsuneonella dongtanensis]ANY20664.1 Alginate biosynthesis sensor protein KinB [Tsuneonella dongtanensis]